MNKSPSGIPVPSEHVEFRNKGHQIIDMLSENLKDALSGKGMAEVHDKQPGNIRK
jgi:hypothetical protein